MMPHKRVGKNESLRCRINSRIERDVASPYFLWLAEELHYRSHLRSGERLGVLLVALGTHRLPHTAREVHLFAKVPQGTVIVVVGVVQLG